MSSGSAIGKCLCVRFSTCATLRAGGNHRGLPLQKGVSVGVDPRVCPNSHVEIISRRHLLWSAEAKLPPTLKLTLQHSKGFGARLPSPTWWERGMG